MNQDALLNWFNKNQRALAWRMNPSPWSILLSEILLQQTQMERGIEYHQRLFERFPTPSSMAESEVDEVLFLWQGAGYYSTNTVQDFNFFNHLKWNPFLLQF